MGYGAKSIDDWRDDVYQCAKEHGFHEEPKTMGDYCALIHSEVSEALEDFRAGAAPNLVWYLDKQTGEKHAKQKYDAKGAPLFKPCGIPSEMADVIIRCLDFCGAHGIDIEQAIRMKHNYNLTRPFKHGKKI